MPQGHCIFGGDRRLEWIITHLYVLSLRAEQLPEHRLQTIIFRLGLARPRRLARVLIKERHIW